MEIVKAEVLGFCVGVRRAVEMIEREVRENGSLATFGAVVHNPHVVQELAKKGARVVESLDEIEEGTVAITAHGVGEEIYKEVEWWGLRLVDTTCPIVRKAQRAAHKLANEGFRIVIYGEESHPEVQGILGWTKGKGIAILDPETKVSIPGRKVALLSQTTKGQQSFVQFVAEFLARNMDRINEVRVMNTTCPETSKRYDAARKLASYSDMIIVIGGRNSANTRKLAQVCALSGVETHQIEDAAEIKLSWLAGKTPLDKHEVPYQRVGVTAGASTPDSAIALCINRLQELIDTVKVKESVPIRRG